MKDLYTSLDTLVLDMHTASEMSQEFTKMWCAHVVCTCGVHIWCAHVVCTCGMHMWCAHVVCTCGVRGTLVMHMCGVHLERPNVVYSYRVLVGTEVFGSIGGVAEALVTAMVCATVRSFTGV